VEPVIGDLGADTGITDLIAHLDGRAVDVLVNNAGFGTYGQFAEIDAGREHDLVAVNVDALVRPTHAVLPGMLARSRGGILNVASTIAFQPGPYQATGGRILPGRLSTLVSGRMLRPADGAGSKVRS
jgi:short-subunit dehydrogenase